MGAGISAAAPLAAVDGDNPFKRPAGNTGCTYALAVIGAMAGMAVLVAPFVVPALLWDGNWRFVLAAGGAVWGWLVWRHGVARAMRTLERHGPDLMAELTLGDMSFKLNLTNLTDKLYADMLYRGHYIAGKPRTVQLTTAFQF